MTYVVGSHAGGPRLALGHSKRDAPWMMRYKQIASRVTGFIRQIASRMTGFSTPFFGVSWQPPAAADRDVARKVLSKLESKRALYQEAWQEVPEHLIQSVLQIREMLDEVIGNGEIAEELNDPLRKMRRACIKFLDEAPDVAPQRRRLALPGGRGRWVFIGMNGYEALEEMRAVFLQQIKLIADRYGIDVEEPLASRLPKDPTHD